MNKNPIEDLKKYREFLETIPLDKYREELKDIKWVEQDLPKEILPLASKETMKLLRNFHLTKVKQNFFLFLTQPLKNLNLRACIYVDMYRKKIPQVYMKRYTWKSHSIGSVGVGP